MWKFPLFEKWFPNVRHLELYTTFIYSNCMHERFAQLKHLLIDVTNHYFTVNGFTAGKAVHLMQLN